ncbi:hypothetical protein GURASL_37020 [Geotalea uraniireducens]|uniref:DNA-binding protein n=1 Tax=Geotalea uraniireducens TaxID=351604 RepID=A0ABM8EQL2_9BACT|nr:DNA-binding protein [Geotalea uraniireducens]BDV44779.1 hypothetical protein GURASL_37020 [Geotalea uraniireducens]
MKMALRLAALAGVLSFTLQAHAFSHSQPMGGDTTMGGVTTVPLSGKVVETFNSGGYTYVSLEKDGKKTWVAIPETAVEVGRELSLKPGVEMTNFQSKGLKRTFATIYFSEGLASSVESTKGKGSKGSSGGVTVPAEKITVKKATGPDAYTIAEVYKEKAKLDGKKVTVRGKVTKVSAGIMGRNWVHIQDGTGNAEAGSHDLTVTSQDLPAVGEVVTVNGTLHSNRDFGGGYKYQAIVEDGTIKQ